MFGKLSLAKTRLNTLFAVHAVTAWLSGALAVGLPHVFEAFMVAHGDSEGWHPGGSEKIVHLVIRLYGCLILGQGFIVWSARSLGDGAMRKALVQAYALIFALMFVSLLRAQLTGGMLVVNWLNVALFGALCAFYSWFVFVQPPAVYELPNRVAA